MKQHYRKWKEIILDFDFTENMLKGPYQEESGLFSLLLPFLN